MDGWTENILTFVGENRDWAFWIAMVFAIGENTAFVSIIIPSTAILMGVGALVATGELSLLPIFLGAAIGAMIGSFLSYFIGWRYGSAILGAWPLRNHPDQVERGNAAFRRWGPIAILFGHFIGPLRAVVFVMAGISRIPLRIFAPINVAGCIGWAYLTPLVGEVAGHAIGWLWTLFS